MWVIFFFLRNNGVIFVPVSPNDLFISTRSCFPPPSANRAGSSSLPPLSLSAFFSAPFLTR